MGEGWGEALPLRPIPSVETAVADGLGYVGHLDVGFARVNMNIVEYLIKTITQCLQNAHFYLKMRGKCLHNLLIHIVQ